MRDSDHIVFRPLTRGDLPLLSEWLRRPHVAEWWDSPGSVEELEEEYGSAIDGASSTRPNIVLLGDRHIGFMQVYTAVDHHAEGWWLDETDPGVRGIDQFLANARDLGQGLGTAMVREFVSRLLSDPAVTRVQTDPDVRNARAIRCYEKAGFRSAGELDTPDGRALLMYRDRP